MFHPPLNIGLCSKNIWVRITTGDPRKKHQKVFGRMGRGAKASAKATIIVKPVPKHVLSSAVVLWLENEGHIIEFQRVRTVVYATYSTPETAAFAVERLHGKLLGEGGPVTVEIFENRGTVALSKEGASAHENVKSSKGAGAAAAEVQEAQADAGEVEKIVLPGEPQGGGFTGLYIVQLLRLTSSTNRSTASLARLLSNKRPSQAKEICESFGATRALFDFDRVHGLGLREKRVVAIVPGDGCRPYTSSALLLQVPQSWVCYSVDPLLASGKALAVARDQPRLTLVPALLEDFTLPDLADVDAVVILAVHSHAPLQSFWTKLPDTLQRVCVSIPCCGDYGWLSTSDLKVRYVDREIDCPTANTVLVYERKAGASASSVCMPCGPSQSVSSDPIAPETAST